MPHSVAYPGNCQGGPFSRPRKVDDLFLGDYHLLTFLVTDPNPTSIISQILKGVPSARPPVFLSLVFFKPSKIIFRHPKGGHGPLAPPRYATGPIVYVFHTAYYRCLTKFFFKNRKTVPIPRYLKKTDTENRYRVKKPAVPVALRAPNPLHMQILVTPLFIPTV
jgi:hypothetical protein